MESDHGRGWFLGAGQTYLGVICRELGVCALRRGYWEKNAIYLHVQCAVKTRVVFHIRPFPYPPKQPGILARMHHTFARTDASACTLLASRVQGDLSRLAPTKSALQGASLIRGRVSDAG